MNGREILARCLEGRGIGYGRHANAFTTVTDLDTAQRLADRLARRKWPVVLRDLAARVNPLLETNEAPGFQGYWWGLDQTEVANDEMAARRYPMAEVLPDRDARGSRGSP